MPLLELTPTRLAPRRFAVDVRYADATRVVAYRRTVDDPTDDEDRTDLRWYFEEFPVTGRQDSARADAVVRRMARLGELLFGALLPAEPEADGLVQALRRHIHETDVVVHDAATYGELQWQLLRDPTTGEYVTLAARSFVHGFGPATAPTRGVLGDRAQPRILLVISRPAGQHDIPFRNVADGILSTAAAVDLDVDVLRPPDPGSLARTLRTAHAARRPYDIVHIDGHGSYETPPLHAPHAAPTTHGPAAGVLVFESATADDGEEYLGGHALAALLAETGVRLLVLNACRSGAGWTTSPTGLDTGGGGNRSVAADVARGGHASVVAMSYNVSETTAARFVRVLYSALGSGDDLGTATTEARRHLAAPVVEGGPGATDWLVPVTLQTGPFRVAGRNVPPAERPHLGPQYINIVGRDDALLALDRAFDGTSAVVLWGAGGVGKSAVARSFASWYRETGGADAVHIIDFLDRPASLPTEPEARTLVVLDNVDRDDDDVAATSETTSGLLSRWRRAGVKILLTTRRPDGTLVPPDARRVTLDPLHPIRTVELAGHYARQIDDELADYALMRPVIEFSRGIPLVLQAAFWSIAQALSRGPIDVSALVRALAEDDELLVDPDGRLAGIRRGFAAYRPATDDTGLTLVASLSLFRGAVTATALAGTQEEGETAADFDDAYQRSSALLASLAEGGIVIPVVPPEVFTVHPLAAVPLRREFDHHFGGDRDTARAAERRYVVAMGTAADAYFSLSAQHYSTSLAIATLMELNLWRALEVAEREEWWELFTGPSQGLRNLLRLQGRWDEWGSVVERLERAYVDPVTAGPRTGLEPFWPLAAQCRTEYAYDTGDTEFAAAWVARVLPFYARLADDGTRAVRSGTLDDCPDHVRSALWNYVAAMQDYCRLQPDPLDDACLLLHEESAEFATALRDSALTTTALVNLVQALNHRERFDESERLVTSALATLERGAYRSKLLDVLARTLYLRARATHKRVPDSGERYLDTATARQVVKLLRQSVAEADPNASADLAHARLWLGNVLDDLGESGQAIREYEKARSDFAQLGDDFNGALVTDNLSICYERLGQVANALYYAGLAFEVFQRQGPRAAHLVADTAQRMERLQLALSWDEPRSSHDS
jgi:tetratricopeptide (TPR) repeat protein